MLSSQLENVVRKHHEVHQAIGRLNMPLSMRFLWVAPLLARIYSASLLQVRVQHWEISQEICKLINRDHESVSQLVDFRIEENVGIREGIFLPEESIDELDKRAHGVQLKLALLQHPQLRSTWGCWRRASFS